MIHEIIRHLNRKVEEIISNDDMEYGKFTRAYILRLWRKLMDW